MLGAAMQAATAALDELPLRVRLLAILGGGALRASFDGTTVKDYDLFFRSDEDFLDTIAVLMEAPKWIPIPSKTPGRHYTFRSPQGREFNVIGIFFGSPKDHIDRFDFRCCGIAAWFGLDGTPHFQASPEALKDCIEKRLVVRNNNGTERTLARIKRYEAYGYTYADAGAATDKRYTLKKHGRYIRKRVKRLPVSSHGY